MDILTIEEWAIIAQLLTVFFVYSFFIDFGNFAYSFAYKYRWQVKRTNDLMKMKFLNHKPYDLIGRYRDLINSKVVYGKDYLSSFNKFNKFKQFKIALLNLKNIKKGGF